MVYMVCVFAGPRAVEKTLSLYGTGWAYISLTGLIRCVLCACPYLRPLTEAANIVLSAGTFSHSLSKLLSVAAVLSIITMAGTLARRAIDHLKSKEFREYLMR